MKSAPLGKDILGVEVLNVSRHGFWLLVQAEELFVEFDQFPWFRDASIAEITNVSLPSSHHLYWSDLDVDLAVESLRDPKKYPLISNSGT